MLDEAVYRLCQARWCDQNADAPAGHAEGLGKAVGDEEARTNAGNRLKPRHRLAIGQVRVDLIENEPEIVPLGKARQQFKLLARHHAGARVRWGIDRKSTRLNSSP